jgi:outer membrane protein assembly factor BamB
MTVIELGSPGSPPVRPAPGRRRGHRRADVRRITIAQVLLCVLVFGGSAQPGFAMDVPAWSLRLGPANIVTVGRDAVFVLSGGTSVDDGSRVTAFGLGDGEIQWSTPVPIVRGAILPEQPGALMVPVVLDDGTPATETLDLRRGGLRWRLPGDVIEATPEAVVLGGVDVALRRVRMADGATIWSRPADGLASWTVAGQDQPTARLVEAGVDGRVRTLRLTDGAPELQGRLPNGRYVPMSGGLIAAAGIVYVNLVEQDRAMVTAYDLNTLALRWQFARTSPKGSPTGPAARDCGIVLCFRDGARTVGLDTGTGAVRWHTAGWIDMAPTSDRRRLLATSPDHAAHALIDSADGRVTADLGAGTPVWDYRHSAPLYYLTAVEPAGSGFEVSRINLRTGRLEPRGVLSGVDQSGCTANDGKLICRTTNDRLTITRVG